jgi:hypothetical protein
LERACDLFKGFGPGGGLKVCRNRKAAFLFQEVWDEEEVLERAD